MVEEFHQLSSEKYCSASKFDLKTCTLCTLTSSSSDGILKELGEFKCEIAYFFFPANVGVSILDVTGGGMYPCSQMYIFWSLLVSLLSPNYPVYNRYIQVPIPIVGYLQTHHGT